jgi:MOSC domain-containing protein YiiM
MAEVTAIHIGPDQSPAPLTAVTEVEAVVGKGLKGDRKYGTHRHISIVSTEELEEAAANWGAAIPTGSTRRQITITGSRLPRDEGVLVRLGEVVVAVNGDCSPCHIMESSVGPGARDALVHLAGITGSIVEGGTIHVGDAVEFE